jgi:hypothetical protein
MLKQVVHIVTLRPFVSVEEFSNKLVRFRMTSETDSIVTFRMVRVTNNYGIRRMIGFITVSCTFTRSYTYIQAVQRYGFTL